MTVDTANSDLTFTIYALGDVGGSDGKPVPADVFVRKMKEILDALKEADRSANHGVRHEYLIADLKKGSAEITFAERPVPSMAGVVLHSSFYEFERCVDAVFRNDVTAVRKFNGLLEKVTRVAEGAGERFAYIKIERGSDGRDYRADSLLLNQARRIGKEIEAQRAEEYRPPRLFRGQAIDGFDGSIKEVDLRGRVKRCKFVLSDSTKELDCEFVDFSLDEIKDVLDCRVWADGDAIYNGEHGLPDRFLIRAVRKVQPKRDVTTWRGTLGPMSDLGDDWLE